MIKIKGLVAACFFLFVLLYTLPQSWGFRNLTEGEKVPGFTLKNLDGKTYSLSQSKGKVTIILYWRVGQERSFKALKALKTVFEKLSDQPLQILAITKDTDKISDIKDIRKSLEIPYPILLDKKSEVYSKFGVFVFPATALIERQGIYRSHYGGFRENYFERIYGDVRVFLGLITKEELDAEKGEDVSVFTEEQKRAINHIKLGKTLTKRGMHEKAITEFKHAVELDKDNPEGHILLGVLLLDQEKTDQALHHLKMGISLDPRSIDAKIGLGRAYRMKGQADKAIEILQQGLNLSPDSAPIHLELGKIYESLGKTDQALKHYKTSAESSLKTNTLSPH